MTSLAHDITVFLEAEKPTRRPWISRALAYLRHRYAEHVARQALARLDPRLLADVGYESDPVLGEIRRTVPDPSSLTPAVRDRARS